MLVTAQTTIFPYVVVAVLGFVTQAVMAAPMFAFVMAVSACAQGRTRCAINAAAAQRQQPLGSREAALRRRERGPASPTTSTAAQSTPTHAVPRRIRLGIPLRFGGWASLQGLGGSDAILIARREPKDG